MPYPTYYTRQFDFQSYQNANPTRPLPGDKVNADLNLAEIAIGETIDFLKNFTRSDGQIANAVVGIDQLKQEVLDLIGEGGGGGGGGSMTGAEILAELVTVDGTGSGLDADTLDGLEAAAFALASHTHTVSALSDASANAKSLLQAADYAAMRGLLDLEAGTDFYSIAAADAAFQPKDADLTAIAALTTTAAGRSVLTFTDPNADRLVAWDDSGAAAAPIALADIADEGAPAAGDYLIIYLADGSLARTNWSNLPGAGGGISNVVEDTTPQLGGDLDANAFDIQFDDATGIRDDSDNEQLIFQKTASAINHFEMTNASVGTSPILAAVGDDTNISITLTPKGTGQILGPNGAAGTPAYSFASDPNTGMYGNGSDALLFTAGGTTRLAMTTSALRPNANDILALGSATISWSDVFLADGGTINANNGNTIVTMGSGVFNISTGALQVGGVAVPTISSSSTLSNKTLASPVITGPKKLVTFTPLDNVPPAADYATLDWMVGTSTPAENIPVLDFDDTTAEYADFYGVMPHGYAGGGVTVIIMYSAAETSTDVIDWECAFRRVADDAEDLDTTAQTYDYNDVVDTAPSAVGEVAYASITFTDGADMDSVTAGDYFILRVRRDPTPNSGTDVTGDASIHAIYIRES